MTIAIVILALALLVSLAFNMGFLGGAKPSAQAQSNLPSPSREAARDDGDVSSRLSKAEAELDKKRKELDEVKKAQGELKDELKAAKKKLFDQKEADKSEEDLKKARAEVERHASQQLDSTRAELAQAHQDIQKLRAEIEMRGKKQAQPKPDAAETTEKKIERAPEPPPQRVIRELSEHEKERIARLEQQSANDRRRAAESERETRNLKAKIDKQLRDVKAAFTDANLHKDKFRAVEQRLNRTLLENDVLRRAIADLEKKTGMNAEKVGLTPDEIAQSDRQMAQKHAEEDRVADEARAKLEAQKAAELEAEHAEAEQKAIEAAKAEAQAKNTVVTAEVPVPAAEAVPPTDAAAAAPSTAV